MPRQLQVCNGVASAEWMGGGAPPSAPDPSWTFVDVTDRPDVKVGMLFDGVNFSEPPTPPDYGRTVDAREFMLLFTVQERKAIRVAAKTDEDVADWLSLAQVPTPIRVKHPTTVAGLDALVAKGLLTAQRKAAIVGA